MSRLNKLRELDLRVWEAQKNMTPDAIICGSWPCEIPGSLRVACSHCKVWISLAPESGQKIHLKFPGIPLICFHCFLESEKKRGGVA